MNLFRALQRVPTCDLLHTCAQRTFSITPIATNKQPPKKPTNNNKNKTKEFKVPQKTAELNTSPTAEFNEIPIVHVKLTQNNTLVYLSDHLGTIKTWTSAGLQGFKNSRRGTNYAGKVAAEEIAKRALEYGVTNVRVKLKGLGPGRRDSVVGLSEGGLNIVSLTDVTPTPHNGPKPRKARRL